MIIGIGIDIVENERIKKLFLRFGDHFLNKIFTKNEIYDINFSKKPIQKIASRFAAKEAFYKSLNNKKSYQTIFWKEVEVQNDEFGSPKLILYGKSKNILDLLTPKGYKPIIHLSLSDERLNTIALVVFEVR